MSHAMAYDSVRAVTVLFGGARYTVRTMYPLGDCWEWDGTRWSEAPSGPEARMGHAMAYDSARGVTVLFGGYDGNRYCDTWEYDGLEWTRRATTGPPVRYDHAMAYDSSRSVTVLVGGEPGRSDTWEWDGSTWFERPGLPHGILGHGMAYDSARNVTVLYGGRYGPYYPETWEWDGCSWNQRTGDDAGERSWLAMAYDSARSETVLCGGLWYSSVLSNTAVWDGSWLDGPSLPTGRARHALAFDSARGVAVMFGGWDGQWYYPALNDTWEYDAFRWVPRMRGDLNCDTQVNTFDIDPFVLALASPGAYSGTYPDCTRLNADCNGDGAMNVFDIDPFVRLLTGR